MIESPIQYLAKLNHARQSLDGPLIESIARAVGESSLQLVEHHRIAAVLIAVRGGFQEAWSRREELSTDLYEKLDAVDAPARGTRVPFNFRELDRAQPVQRSTCSNCRIRPGFGPCPRCSGVGVLLVQRPGSDNSTVQDCPACDDGFATCTVCGGSTESLQATVRYVNYKPFDTNHIVSAAYRDALQGAFPAPSVPPDELAYDVEGSGGQSPYRGQQVSMDRDFHGHRFDDALKQARAFVQRVQSAPNFILHELQTYALPFVLATFDSPSRTHRSVLYIGADGTPGVSVL